MATDDEVIENYMKENIIASEITEEHGTAIPADSLAQIIQSIIDIDPSYRKFFGQEIRTGFLDDNNFQIYTRALMFAHHLLLRGAMYNIPTKHTVRDILFAAKVIASASTSKNGKLLDTLVSSRRDINVQTQPQQKKSFLSRK